MSLFLNDKSAARLFEPLRTSQPTGALGEELSISFEGGGAGAHAADGGGAQALGAAESLAFASE